MERQRGPKLDVGQFLSNLEQKSSYGALLQDLKEDDKCARVIQTFVPSPATPWEKEKLFLDMQLPWFIREGQLDPPTALMQCRECSLFFHDLRIFSMHEKRHARLRKQQAGSNGTKKVVALLPFGAGELPIDRMAQYARVMKVRNRANGMRTNGNGGSAGATAGGGTAVGAGGGNGGGGKGRAKKGRQAGGFGEAKRGKGKNARRKAPVPTLDALDLDAEAPLLLAPDLTPIEPLAPEIVIRSGTETTPIGSVGTTLTGTKSSGKGRRKVSAVMEEEMYYPYQEAPHTFDEKDPEFRKPGNRAPSRKRRNGKPNGIVDPRAALTSGSKKLRLEELCAPELLPEGIDDAVDDQIDFSTLDCDDMDDSYLPNPPILDVNPFPLRVKEDPRLANDRRRKRKKKRRARGLPEDALEVTENGPGSSPTSLPPVLLPADAPSVASAGTDSPGLLTPRSNVSPVAPGARSRTTSDDSDSDGDFRLGPSASLTPSHNSPYFDLQSASPENFPLTARARQPPPTASSSSSSSSASAPVVQRSSELPEALAKRLGAPSLGKPPASAHRPGPPSTDPAPASVRRPPVAGKPSSHSLASYANLNDSSLSSTSSASTSNATPQPSQPQASPAPRPSPQPAQASRGKPMPPSVHPAATLQSGKSVATVPSPKIVPSAGASATNGAASSISSSTSVAAPRFNGLQQGPAQRVPPTHTSVVPDVPPPKPYDSFKATPVQPDIVVHRAATAATPMDIGAGGHRGPSPKTFLTHAEKASASTVQVVPCGGGTSAGVNAGMGTPNLASPGVNPSGKRKFLRLSGNKDSAGVNVKREQERVYNPDEHCGVIDSNGEPCKKSLTCKKHKINERRNVQGRSQGFDTLLRLHRENTTKASDQQEQQKMAQASQANQLPFAHQRTLSLGASTSILQQPPQPQSELMAATQTITTSLGGGAAAAATSSSSSSSSASGVTPRMAGQTCRPGVGNRPPDSCSAVAAAKMNGETAAAALAARNNQQRQRPALRVVRSRMERQRLAQPHRYSRSMSALYRSFYTWRATGFKQRHTRPEPFRIGLGRRRLRPLQHLFCRFENTRRSQQETVESSNDSDAASNSNSGGEDCYTRADRMWRQATTGQPYCNMPVVRNQTRRFSDITLLRQITVLSGIHAMPPRPLPSGDTPSRSSAATTGSGSVPTAAQAQVFSHGPAPTVQRQPAAPIQQPQLLSPVMHSGAVPSPHSQPMAVVNSGRSIQQQQQQPPQQQVSAQQVTVVSQANGSSQEELGAYGGFQAATGRDLRLQSASSVCVVGSNLASQFVTTQDGGRPISVSGMRQVRSQQPGAMGTATRNAPSFYLELSGSDQFLPDGANSDQQPPQQQQVQIGYAPTQNAARPAGRGVGIRTAQGSFAGTGIAPAATMQARRRPTNQQMLQQQQQQQQAQQAQQQQAQHQQLSAQSTRASQHHVVVQQQTTQPQIIRRAASLTAANNQQQQPPQQQQQQTMQVIPQATQSPQHQQVLHASQLAPGAHARGYVRLLGRTNPAAEYSTGAVTLSAHSMPTESDDDCQIIEMPARPVAMQQQAVQQQPQQQRLAAQQVGQFPQIVHRVLSGPQGGATASVQPAATGQIFRRVAAQPSAQLVHRTVSQSQSQQQQHQQSMQTGAVTVNAVPRQLTVGGDHSGQVTAHVQFASSQESLPIRQQHVLQLRQSAGPQQPQQQTQQQQQPQVLTQQTVGHPNLESTMRQRILQQRHQDQQQQQIRQQVLQQQQQLSLDSQIQQQRQRPTVVTSVAQSGVGEVYLQSRVAPQSSQFAAGAGTAIRRPLVSSGQRVQPVLTTQAGTAAPYRTGTVLPSQQANGGGGDVFAFVSSDMDRPAGFTVTATNASELGHQVVEATDGGVYSTTDTSVTRQRMAPTASMMTTQQRLIVPTTSVGSAVAPRRFVTAQYPAGVTVLPASALQQQQPQQSPAGGASGGATQQVLIAEDVSSAGGAHRVLAQPGVARNASGLSTVVFVEPDMSGQQFAGSAGGMAAASAGGGAQSMAQAGLQGPIVVTGQPRVVTAATNVAMHQGQAGVPAVRHRLVTHLTQHRQGPAPPGGSFAHQQPATPHM